MKKKMLRSAVCCLLAAGGLAVCAVSAGAVSVESVEVVEGSSAESAAGEAVVSGNGEASPGSVEAVLQSAREPREETEPETETPEPEAETEAGQESDSDTGAGTEAQESGMQGGQEPDSDTGTGAEAQESGQEPDSDTGTGTEAQESGQEPDSDTETGTETGPQENETESPINFETLWRTNADIYAWISIPGTVIDYPILQSRGEEDFYLHHNIYGADDVYGSVYTQQLNHKDFSDFLTILYGHNMKDDTMFGWLSEYQSLDVLWDHSVIYIYLPERTLEYWIFAAYVTDNLHQLAGVDPTSREDRQEYIDKIAEHCADVRSFDRRLFSKVTTDSHILTLSTCYQNDPEHRFVVQAVLVEQPAPGTLPEMAPPKTRPETEEAETETEEAGTEAGTETEEGETDTEGAGTEAGAGTETGAEEAGTEAGAETEEAETEAGSETQR